MLATAVLERHFGEKRLRPGPIPGEAGSPEAGSPAWCDTAVVIVAGDLDAALLPAFLEVLDRALTISCHSVVVDLSAVRFLSASAALALGPAQERAWRDHLDLTVLVTSREVERALDVTGMRALMRRR